MPNFDSEYKTTNPITFSSSLINQKRNYLNNNQLTYLNLWTLLELVLGLITLGYFLFYPRDTVSDFIVCSALCFSIIACSSKINLLKPNTRAIATYDYFLALVSMSLYVGAWFYAYRLGKINTTSAITSLLITLMYFYYAWFQHFLAQRYTAVRMKSFVEKSTHFPTINTHVKAAFLTGIVFGILHIPYPELMLPAALGGAAYAFYFLNTGRLWAVVVSHSLIASSWIYWGLDSNAFEEFIFW
jgi:membrane protease YdiL (CAAX protease family)